VSASADHREFNEPGLRRLVGLTAEETREFADLDRLPVLDDGGQHIDWINIGRAYHDPRAELAGAVPQTRFRTP
jgi:hypothetical protein